MTFKLSPWFGKKADMSRFETPHGMRVPPVEIPYPHQLYSLVPSVFGILAILFQIIVLFGIPQKFSPAIRAINFISVQSSSNNILGAIQGVGLPSYLAFSLLGYCVTDSGASGLSRCKLGFGSETGFINFLDKLGPGTIHSMMIAFYVICILTSLGAVVAGLRSRAPVKASLFYTAVAMISSLIALISAAILLGIAKGFFSLTMDVFKGMGMTVNDGAAFVITKIYIVFLVFTTIGFAIKVLWYYRKALGVYMLVIEVITGVWFVKQAVKYFMNRKDKMKDSVKKGVQNRMQISVHSTSQSSSQNGVQDNEKV
ncbi:hypothetical protein BC936DRAFT_138863 [Jimgerdemannia flammicorona]|uniref:Uncharacterized protein n=1 Tax=Jimgerdemannia flammicorona TaxID=994334 RepID=A0A433DI37_9FUNG|nr:hypothetical protein BC936DRAFT_138863 [Jimgerdemannia flammicorona]